MTTIVRKWITPWSRVLLENVTSSQPVKKFPALGSRRFIISFTVARHLSPSWARSIPSMPPPVPLLEDQFFILSSHLRLRLLSALFPSGFPTKTLYACLFSTYTCYVPLQSHSSRFDHPNNIRWGVQIIQLLPHSSVSLSLLGPSILLSTLFSHTPSLHFSLNVGDKGSRPFETAGTIEFCIT